jgi:hypothetical protein
MNYIEYTVEVWADGDKRWLLNGKTHRIDGPALELASGGKSWYINGYLHREDGPAIEWANGDKAWYLNGKHYSEAGFNAELAKRKQPQLPSCEGKVVEIEGKKYRLTEV